MQFTTRKVVVAGMLSAVAILLSVIPGLGYIPVPTEAGSATIMHIPAIIGGIIGGPIVGALVGLVFGLTSFVRATSPLFKDPIIAILPRLLIGVAAFAIYFSLRRWNDTIAVGAAAVAGTLTNTILVLTLAVVRGYIAPEVALGIGITHGIPEVVVATLLTVAVVAAVKGVRLGLGRARI